MARLQELIPYLKQGFTLECANHDTLTPTVSPVDRRLVITGQKPETEARVFWPKDYSLAEVRAMNPIWEYGVMFMDENKRPIVLTRIADIEQAIQEGKPHTTWGKEPREV